MCPPRTSNQAPTRHTHATAQPTPPLQTNNWGKPKQLVLRSDDPRWFLQREGGKKSEGMHVCARLGKGGCKRIPPTNQPLKLTRSNRCIWNCMTSELHEPSNENLTSKLNHWIDERLKRIPLFAKEIGHPAMLWLVPLQRLIHCQPSSSHWNFSKHPQM